MNSGKSDLKVLYEPVAPYFVSSYNTLISIVQSLALAALFWMINELFQNNSLNIFVICELIIAFLIICLGWHRYITHNQYLAWSVGLPDTIIPMGFALLQIFLILSIPTTIFYFSLCMTALFVWGSIAYLNSLYHHGTARTQRVYKEHFATAGDGFADNFFSVMKAYEKNRMIEMLVMSCISSIVVIFIHFTEYDDMVKTSVAIIVYVTSFIPLLFLGDLRKTLNKAEKLRIYGYRW